MSRLPKKSDDEIRRILRRVETMEGLSNAEQADRLEVRPQDLLAWKKRTAELFPDVPGPWQHKFNGKGWEDMPGSDDVTKRMNFSLFRRGALVVDETGKVVRAGIRRKGQWRSRRKPTKPTKPKPAADLEPEDADIEGLREGEEDDPAIRREKDALNSLLTSEEEDDPVARREKEALESLLGKRV